MFQPAGGMDMIVKAFQKKLEQVIKLEAEVIGMTLLGEEGVAVEYRHASQVHTEVADYCVSTIPLPVLQNTRLSNFSPGFHEAIQAVKFAATCKVGWQANERFWEDDPDNIYGGISWTDHTITQMWYPSNDYFSQNGTLTGAYNFDDCAEALGNMEPKDRLKEARQGAAELHGQFTDEDIVPTGKGVSIAWHKVPYQLGGWAAWNPSNSEHMQAYKQLLQPEGDNRFFVAGDQASPSPAGRKEP